MPHTKTNKAVLGLGTNLGNKKENLQQALESIAVKIGKITKQSGFYASAPHGFESANDFLNMVIEIETGFGAFDLLALTQELELEKGRKSKSSQGIYRDRLLDIDILFFNDEIIETGQLHIPHKNLRDRKFVLVPLVEILPNFRDPKSQKTSTDLLKLTTDKSQIFLL